MPKLYTNYKKTSKTPRKPFDRERLMNELKLVGTYGLKNKREVWRVQLTLAKLRKAARELMTLDETDPRRLFEGDALIRRIVKLGLLSHEQRKLDYVLGLTTNQFMERRLQTFVTQKQFAQSVHHARVRIRQRHLCIGKQLVNIPSFMVSKQSESHITLAPTSVFVTGKMGRQKRKRSHGAKGGDDAE
jgi:small subunit ribosomal protein S9e